MTVGFPQTGQQRQEGGKKPSHILETSDFKNDPYNLTGKLLRNKKYLKGQKGTGDENQLRAKM